MSYGDGIVKTSAGPRPRFYELKQRKQKRIKLPAVSLQESGLKRAVEKRGHLNNRELSGSQNNKDRYDNVNKNRRRKIGEDFIERIKQKQDSYKISAHDVVDFNDFKRLGEMFLA